jgi:hypothetical protein
VTNMGLTILSQADTDQAAPNGSLLLRSAV